MYESANRLAVSNLCSNQNVPRHESGEHGVRPCSRVNSEEGNEDNQKNSWLLVGDCKILFLRVALFVATERFKLTA